MNCQDAPIIVLKRYRSNYLLHNDSDELFSWLRAEIQKSRLFSNEWHTVIIIIIIIIISTQIVVTTNELVQRQTLLLYW